MSVVERDEIIVHARMTERRWNRAAIGNRVRALARFFDAATDEQCPIVGCAATFRRAVTAAGVAGLLVLPLGAQSGNYGHLRLKVQLPPRLHGRVAWSVFASPAGFPA